MKHIKKTIIAFMSLILIMGSALPARADDSLNLFEVTMKGAVNEQTVKQTVFNFLIEYDDIRAREAEFLDLACNNQDPGINKEELVETAETLTTDMKALYMKSSDVISLIKMFQVSEAATNPTRGNEVSALSDSIKNIRTQIYSDGITINAIKETLLDPSIDFNALKAQISEKNALEAEKAAVEKELGLISLKIIRTTSEIEAIQADIEANRFESLEGENAEEVLSGETEYIPGEEVDTILTAIAIEVSETAENLQSLQVALTEYQTMWNGSTKRLAELESLIDNANKNIKLVLIGEITSEQLDTSDIDEVSDVSEVSDVAVTDLGGELVDEGITESTSTDIVSAHPETQIYNEEVDLTDNITIRTVNEYVEPEEEPEEQPAIPENLITYAIYGVVGVIVLVFLIITLRKVAKKKKDKAVEEPAEDDEYSDEPEDEPEGNAEPAIEQETPEDEEDDDSDDYSDEEGE